ncbi:hypothetical protein PLICRDRAFT_35813 [Plicaturopsis crispa FD-325 SS-3]|nr:hypothetical protein PLICRDRAFT_35813 [Plicaturopsis crispa FD-325 SS-3]
MKLTTALVALFSAALVAADCSTCAEDTARNPNTGAECANPGASGTIDWPCFCNDGNYLVFVHRCLSAASCSPASSDAGAAALNADCAPYTSTASAPASTGGAA